MRDETARAAVNFFLETQKGRWRSLEEMPHNNPGFDIRAVAQDGHEEVIEIKGQSGPWTEIGVALTPTELACAQKLRDRYWLCVVQYATDNNRRQLFLVKDPFGLTTQFRFDSGWKSQAISESVRPLKPDAGMKIKILNEGDGRILSVKPQGQFFKLHLRLDKGGQIFRTYNPATMQLATE